VGCSLIETVYMQKTVFALYVAALSTSVMVFAS